MKEEPRSPGKASFRPVKSSSPSATPLTSTVSPEVYYTTLIPFNAFIAPIILYSKFSEEYYSSFSIEFNRLLKYCYLNKMSRTMDQGLGTVVAWEQWFPSNSVCQGTVVT